MRHPAPWASWDSSRRNSRDGSSLTHRGRAWAGLSVPDLPPDSARTASEWEGQGRVSTPAFLFFLGHLLNCARRSDMLRADTGPRDAPIVPGAADPMQQLLLPKNLLGKAPCVRHERQPQPVAPEDQGSGGVPVLPRQPCPWPATPNTGSGQACEARSSCTWSHPPSVLGSSDKF